MYWNSMELIKLILEIQKKVNLMKPFLSGIQKNMQILFFKNQKSLRFMAQKNRDSRTQRNLIKYCYGTSNDAQQQISEEKKQETKDRNIKVVAINGSHREGNTQFMVEFILKSLNKNPAFSTNQINLREKSIEYCNAQDYQCTLTQNCSCCRDDMAEIFKLLESADLIIMGSPTYFHNVSGRMKNLIDRCNPYRQNQKLAGKSVVVISVGGCSEKSVEEMISVLTPWIKVMGMKIFATFFTIAQKPNEVAKTAKAIEQLKQLVGRIQSSFKIDLI